MNKTHQIVEVVADYRRDDGAAIYALEQAIEDNMDAFSLDSGDSGFAYAYGSEEGHTHIPYVEAEGDLTVAIDVSGSANTPEHEADVIRSDFGGVGLSERTCVGDCDECHRRRCNDWVISGSVVLDTVKVDGKRLIVTVKAIGD